jgi:hypothetical protein
MKEQFSEAESERPNTHMFLRKHLLVLKFYYQRASWSSYSITNFVMNIRIIVAG